MIDIEIHTRLVVDDAIFFDTKIDEEQAIDLGIKAKIAGSAASLVEAKDEFDFIANLKAIPFKNQVKTIALIVIGGILILVNSIIGVHDQFVPESQTYFYSHYDSDGDGDLVPDAKAASPVHEFSSAGNSPADYSGHVFYCQ